MKRSALVLNLLIVVLVLFSSFNISLVFSDTPTSSQNSPALQEWFLQHGYAINVTTDETGIETFPAGYYKMTILAEIAGYAPMNNLSWYPTSNGQLNGILYGENTTGDIAFFTSDETLSLCLGSPEGYFYAEPWRNEDEEDHALVFINPNATGYIIAWEDKQNLGDHDFQDLILEVLPLAVNVDVCYRPRTLNLKSRGRWITAIVKLPKEYEAENVNISSITLNGTVPADSKHYATFDCEELHLLILKFNRTAVIELIKSSLEDIDYKKRAEVWLTITGNFSDGLPFQGTNRIRVIHLCARVRTIACHRMMRDNRLFRFLRFSSKLHLRARVQVSTE